MADHQQAADKKSDKRGDTHSSNYTSRLENIRDNADPAEIVQRMNGDPRNLTNRDITDLHRTLGNRAVMRLLNERGISATQAAELAQRADDEETEGHAPDGDASIQRQPADAVSQTASPRAVQRGIFDFLFKKKPKYEQFENEEGWDEQLNQELSRIDAALSEMDKFLRALKSAKRVEDVPDPVINMMYDEVATALQIVANPPEDYLTGAVVFKRARDLLERVDPGSVEEFGEKEAEIVLDKEDPLIEMADGTVYEGNTGSVGQFGTFKLTSKAQGAFAIGRESSRESESGISQDGLESGYEAKFEISEFLGAIAAGRTQASAVSEAIGIRSDVDLQGELRLGAGFSSSGSLSASLSGIKGQLAADAFLGAKAKGSAKATLTTVDGKHGLKFTGEGEAFAGLEANFGLAASLGKEGLSIAIEGGAFAGVKASAQGNATLMIGGRDLGSIGGEASVTAGIGASGKLKFQTTLGMISFDVGGGLTIGVGAEAAVNGSLDLLAMQETAKDAYDYLKHYKARSQGYQQLPGVDDYRNWLTSTKAILTQHKTDLQEQAK